MAKTKRRTTEEARLRREAGCAFCGTMKKDLPDLVLVSGDGASICAGCLDTVREVLEARLPDEGEGHPPPDLSCDFCGGKGNSVRGLIMGAFGSICAECAKKLVG